MRSTDVAGTVTATALVTGTEKTGRDMAASKRQTTMAKIARERAVLDKRARKAERKEERKRAAAEQAEHGEYGARRG